MMTQVEVPKRQRIWTPPERKIIAPGGEQRSVLCAPPFMPGFGFTPGCRAMKSGAFDPSTYGLTGWWRGSYSASPWTGVASAGSSGSRDLTEATNPPAAGAAVSGFSPAQFDGSNDILANATAISTLVPTAGYFYWILFYVDALDANSTNTLAGGAFANEGLIADTGGYFGCALSNNPTNGVQVWHFQTSSKGNHHTISLTTWNLICARFDGANIRSSLNGGTISNAAATGYDVATGTFRMGVNFGVVFSQSRILDCGLRNSAGADSDFADVLAYVRSRYPGTGI